MFGISKFWVSQTIFFQLANFVDRKLFKRDKQTKPKLLVTNGTEKESCSNLEKTVHPEQFY